MTKYSYKNYVSVTARAWENGQTDFQSCNWSCDSIFVRPEGRAG